MELLLFLSAMLAGLTGLISGDRSFDARPVERVTVAAAAAVEVAQSAVEATSEIEAPQEVARPFASGDRLAHAASDGIVPRRIPVDERRLE